MHDSSSHRREQQRRSVGKRREQASPEMFFNALTDERLFDKLECCLPEHRQRSYTPTDTLSLFLSQVLNADHSCQNTVNDWFMSRELAGLSRVSINTGAYCRARQRLPTQMVRELVRYSGYELSQRTPSGWKWNGRSVKLVDGTTVSMPDTEKNQQVYPQLKSQQEGLGFPLCRAVGIVDLGSGAVLDVALGPCQGKGSNEQGMLRELLDSFEAGDVLLGDAYFPSYFLLCALQDRGVDCVCEQMGSRKRSSDFRTGRSLGKHDHLIVYTKPTKPYWLSQADYEAAPSQLRVRELRTRAGKGTNAKTLVTTLCCEKTYPKAVLKQLYTRRWQVELSFRDIKTTLGMDVLSCRTPEMVEKEIWVYLLAYNLIRTLMAEAARAGSCLPHELSFKHTLTLWLAWHRYGDVRNKVELEALWIAITQKRVANRPGRAEPRKVKRRPKPYPLLRQPRSRVHRRAGHA